MSEETISIVSLNVERSKHLDLVLPFLKNEQPDVCCIQELCESDIVLFEEVLNARSYYIPLSRLFENGKMNTIGIGIFSSLPYGAVKESYYFGNKDTLPVFMENDGTTFNRALLIVDLTKGGKTYRFGTTHFTWTSDGEANDFQRDNLEKLMALLAIEGELVFMGDFNAPRGREIFSRIAECYTDNVPPEYTSSIDADFHRKGNLTLMVDGIFSTPMYHVSDVKVLCGISDHCALVGKVMRQLEDKESV